MKCDLFYSALPFVVSVASIFGSDAWAQETRHSAIGKWNLKASCKEVRLEPTTLVTVRRRQGFYNSSTCEDSSDEGRAKAAQESIPEIIPLDSITTIVREVVTRKPVQEEINKMVDPDNLISSVGEESEAGMLALAAPALMLATAGALSPFRGVKTHMESVRIIWDENGTPRNSIFYLSRKNADSFLNRLAQAVGKNWTEVRFDSKAQEEHATQVLVHFNVPVGMGGEIVVSEGNYKFLMLAASNSTHLVYLFHENSELPQDAVMVLTAETYPLGSAKPWKIKLAHDAEGFWCISEIHTDIERLQLTCRSDSVEPPKKADAKEE